MAKIVIGSGHDQSTLLFKGRAPADSNVEIIVGSGHDMSKREVEMFFHEEKALARELDTLRRQIADLQNQFPQSVKAAEFCKAANVIAGTAELMKNDRKWYSVSAKGLLDAAAAVGSMADPIVKTTLGIIKLLSALKEST